jgi:phosphatidylglycerol:prolipoprotein diacylglycerol transferase
MVHSLDPFILEFWPGFGIRWYGMSYLAGFVFGYFFIYRMASSQRSPLPVRLVADFVTYEAIGTMIGGRLGYVLFYDFDLVTRFKSTFPFWGVLAVNEGGMASHGGMIGIVIACWLFARKHRINLLHLFDLVAASGPIGIFFGRIANFINGELVGRVCPSDYPLAVKFPSDIYTWANLEPGRLSSLSSVVTKLGISQEKWLESVDKMRTDPGAHAFVNNTLVSVVDGIQRGTDGLKMAIEPLLDPRYPSQLFGALGEGLIIFLILGAIWYRPRKPGVVSACFVVFYAIVRIVDEQFRMPDAHLGFQALGLTRGQWLSTGMLAIGLVLLFLWSRRHTVPISGWGRRS